MKTILFFLSFFALISCANTDKPMTENQTSTKSENQNMKTIIVDVRTIEEWNGGHANCSVNYPLDIVETKAEELKNYDKVILVCRSGARAGNAKLQLESLGVKNIENLGAWQNIECE
jgi:rhodanese-related sulfurtransferase